MGNDTTLGDDDVTEELVQLLVVLDRELEMARNNTLLLVVASGIACEFENLSGKVFEDSSKVNYEK